VKITPILPSAPGFWENNLTQVTHGDPSDMMSRILIVLTFLIAGCAPESTGLDILGGQIAGYGTITGKITDASDGSNITNATVYLAGYSGNSTTTAADGTYTLTDAVAGSQSLVVTATGYNNASQSVTVPVDGTVSDVNVSLLTSAFSAGKYVIILTWAAEPRDLDSYLYVPNGGPFKVFFGARGDTDGTLDTDPFAGLDVDDTDGDGPETMTSKLSGNVPHYSGNHRYYVHKFAGTGNITDSSAVVKVYKDQSLVKTYTVPTTGTGDYWHVFDYDQNGTFTDVNTIQVGEPAAP
jgi:uncharacterized protein YfaP (DUF2135 family)